MRILSPCDRPEEVFALFEAGAHELYGGVQPQGWKSTLLSSNQRTFDAAQFTAEASLREAVTRARSLGVPFYMVLNAPLYEPSTYGSVLGLAERAADWGVAGFIVGDLGLLLRLQNLRLGIPVTLSTMAGAMNAETVTFYRGLGARRVVLPRHLTIEEIGQMVAGNPDTEFEAFVLIGRCPNEEAWCSFQHVSTARRWPCEIVYRLEDPAGAALSGDHPLSRWHAQWAEVDRRQGCGLCAIGGLELAGVRRLKLVGRGGPTEGKVANLRLVVRGIENRDDPDSGPEAFRARFGRPCAALNCYFPGQVQKGVRRGEAGRGCRRSVA